MQTLSLTFHSVFPDVMIKNEYRYSMDKGKNNINGINGNPTCNLKNQRKKYLKKKDYYH